MILRLERANDEVDRLERKIRMYQQQKKAAMERRKAVEDEEIVKSVRNLKLNRSELFELLKGLEDGSVGFSEIEQIKEEQRIVSNREQYTSDTKEESEGKDATDNEE